MGEHPSPPGVECGVEKWRTNLLHRLSLRVLPQLAGFSTDPTFRWRKHGVMFVPGLGAFAVFRIAKEIAPFTNPLVVLALSGVMSFFLALWAYRMARRESFSAIFKTDGWKRIGWIGGWVGCVYGVQLSLLVLALLRVFVGYDFLAHPDGPAMMALIIPTMAVARDAFEIGLVRAKELSGTPIVTFPDGASFRGFLFAEPGVLAKWVFPAGLATGMVALGIGALGGWGVTELVQCLAVTLVAGTIALGAYYYGQDPDRGRILFQQTPWLQVLRLWWWPSLTFAGTYYLVLIGGMVYVVGQDPMQGVFLPLLGGMVAGILTLYFLYLGNRVAVEVRIGLTVPDSLQRCPFVMGILSKVKGESPAQPSEAPLPLQPHILEPSGQRK